MATSFEQMIERLDEVLGRIRAANLKLKPTKCRLFQAKVHFLGHVVSEAGIEADPEKVRAVQQWPVPRNVTEVRAFVALAAYYRKFQKGFSAVAAPLHELTRKGEKFVWDERRQRAFDQLKQMLVTAPVLTLPRDEGAFVVDADCSGHATGGVIQQYQDGELKVIAYSSRLLSRSEQDYCTTRCELLAIVHALKQWKTYLLGRRVILRTDHAALLFLQKTPEPSGQEARWLNFLEMFNLELQHRRGTAHSNADALSRRPCEWDTPCRQCRGANNRAGLPAWEPVPQTRPQAVTTRATSEQRKQQDGDRQITGGGSLTPAQLPVDDQPQQQQQSAEQPTSAQSADGGGGCSSPRRSTDLTRTDDNANSPFTWTKDDLAAAQAADADIAPVRDWLIDGIGRPDRKAIASFSGQTRAYWSQWDSLELRENVAYRKFLDKTGSATFYQLLVPQSLRSELTRLVHEKVAGHLGVEKTQSQLQRRGYWPGWRRDVKLFCLNCTPCNSYHRGAVPKRGHLQEMRVGEPMQRLQIDITGPHPKSTDGMIYILTAICAFTKFATAVPLPDKSATTVAQALVENVILKLGSPLSIHSDLGREFENAVMRELCDKLGIEKTHTTPYHSRGNGCVERTFSSLNAMLGKTVSTHQTDWPCHLPFVVSAYNSPEHSSTGFSPSFSCLEGSSVTQLTSC